MTDIEALRARMREAAEKAKAAWDRFQDLCGTDASVKERTEAYQSSDIARAKLEAACDPEVILALDAEITRLREDLDRVTRERDEARADREHAAKAYSLANRHKNGWEVRCIKAEVRAEAAEAALAKSDEEVAGMRRVLAEARDDMQAWQSYASDYFRDKHDAAGDLAKIDQALTKEPTNAE